MTIDEAIAMMREWSDYDCYNEKQHKESEAFNQIAEFLEELKAYRAPIFCGDMTQAMLKEERNKSIDDFAEKLKSECRIHYVDCDPYFGGITESILYKDDIDEIAEQLKAGEIYD